MFTRNTKSVNPPVYVPEVQMWLSSCFLSCVCHHERPATVWGGVDLVACVFLRSGFWVIEFVVSVQWDLSTECVWIRFTCHAGPRLRRQQKQGRARKPALATVGATAAHLRSCCFVPRRSDRDDQIWRNPDFNPLNDNLWIYSPRPCLASHAGTGPKAQLRTTTVMSLPLITGFSIFSPSACLCFVKSSCWSKVWKECFHSHLSCQSKHTNSSKSAWKLWLFILFFFCS